MEKAQHVTALLRRWRGGDKAAHEELVELVYPQLWRLAGKFLRSERAGHTLSSTALVHEAYLKLAEADVEWNDRVHFFAVAARVMRRVLVDHAKRRRRKKRGGSRIRITLEEGSLLASQPEADLVSLDEALTRLAALDERRARVVELHFFGGLTYKEVADVLHTSPTTVNRELRFAKAWLHDQLVHPEKAG